MPSRASWRYDRGAAVAPIAVSIHKYIRQTVRDACREILADEAPNPRPTPARPHHLPSQVEEEGER